MVLADGTIEVSHGEEDSNVGNIPTPFGKGVEVFVLQS